jgi:hypothetical protein
MEVSELAARLGETFSAEQRAQLIAALLAAQPVDAPPVASVPGPPPEAVRDGTGLQAGPPITDSTSDEAEDSPEERARLLSILATHPSGLSGYTLLDAYRVPPSTIEFAMRDGQVTRAERGLGLNPNLWRAVVMKRALLALLSAFLAFSAHAGSVLTQGALNSELGTSCAAQGKAAPCITPAQMSDLIVSAAPGAAGTVAAAGTTQGSAAALPGQINDVTTVPAGSGVILPTAVGGQVQRVCNDGANLLLLYPASGASIGGLGTNAAMSVPVGQCATLVAVSATAWRLQAVGNPSAGIAAAAFYVSPSGNDSNPGTLASPFLTFGQCQIAMRASVNKTCYPRAGTYIMSTGLTLDHRDVGETWSYYPPDGINSAMLTQTGSFAFFTIQTGADEVTITGLAATGNEAISQSGCGSTSQAKFADAWLSAAASAGPNNLTLTYNVLNTFDCGVLLLEANNPTFSFNQLTNIGYAGLFLGHVTGAATQSIFQGNIFYDILPGGTPATNAYAVAGGAASTGNTSNITFLNNQAYNCHTWTCFNAHSGTNLYWYNNIAVFANNGGNVGLFSNIAQAPGTNVNNIMAGNIADSGANGSTINTSAYNMCGNVGCSSNTGITGGLIQNNVELFGSGNADQIYYSPIVTVQNNIGHLNPEQVSSITFAGGGSSASFTHGVANGVAATLAVNMSASYWPFPFPPGTLSIGGTNSGGFAICNMNQICQSAGGVAAGTYSDFSITATLHGMNGSPFTVSAGTLSLTAN